MDDLAVWLRTATTVGYILGVVGGFVFFLSVMNRLGGQITWTGAPAAAAENPQGDGRARRRGLVVVMGILVAFGALLAVVWLEPDWHLGDRVKGWMDTGTWEGLLLVLSGSGMALWGLRRRRASDGGASGGGSLRTKLVEWNAALADDVADLEPRVLAYTRSLGAVTLIAVGLTIVLAGVALLAIAVTRGVDRSAAEAWYFYGLYVAQLIGTGIGYPIGARMERRRVPPGPRYADLRRRRLADYRSPRLRWPVLAVIALQAAAAGMLLLVAGAWVALLMPAFAALAFAVGELHMWSAARVVRMAVTDDPETARRCDDLVRAQVIQRLQQWQFVSIGAAGFMGSYVAVAYARSWASGYLLAASLGSVLLCLLGTLGVAILEERLGGRITGWWGQPMPR